MKKILIFLLLHLIACSLFSEIEYNLEFLINDINPEDRVKEVWLDDMDENGEEEIWVFYYHQVTNDYIDYFRLVSFDFQGTILSSFTKYFEQDIVFKGCSLVKSDGINYRIELYQYYIDNPPHMFPLPVCKIELYNNESNMLVDTYHLEINEPFSTVELTEFDCNFIRHKKVDNNDYVYLGLYQGWTSVYWLDMTRLYRFQILQNSIALIEEIEDGGKDIIFNENYDYFFSVYSKNWHSYPYGGGKNSSINKLSLSVPTTGYAIQNEPTTDLLYVLSKNDLLISTYGLTTAKSYYYNGGYNIELKTYLPDFSGIVWQDTIDVLYSARILNSTCINVEQMFDCILLYYKSSSSTPKVELRNRVNGEVLLNQETTFVPETIIRNQTGDLIFMDHGDASTQIDVYSVNIDFNFPPFVIFPINDIEVDEDFSDPIEINLDFYFADPDEDELSYSFEIDNVIVDLAIDENILTITALENLNGNATVTITADDGINQASRETCETTFDLLISPANDPPQIISYLPEDLSFTITEEQEVNFEVEAEDVDSDEIYVWFVNGEDQNNPENTFLYYFSENGDYEIQCIVSDDEFDVENTWNVTVELTGTINNSVLKTELIGNHPNPFNPRTEIRFQISEVRQIENAEISIYNLKGQKVITLPVILSDPALPDCIEGSGTPNSYSVIWNGKDESGKSVGSGIYYYNLNVDGKTEAVKKCLLLK
ncbi:MAG: hypothetical protein K9N09_07215 [Candidatus Cloacimonetes bacterium]|nr:hypothetical protein [Candidatus Cloacimonadota bacterium]MCF7813795.1 hypothetical protein [Candidatus Cloacimonadota bacterium]MCF7868474.1 hypothetical protein [Candidatus Cloacimonadota bacterium]